MTQAQKKTSGLAVASMIAGMFFWFPLLGILFGIAALIMGVVAYVKIGKRKHELAGEGFAVAGIVLGALGVVFGLMFLLLAAISVPGFLRARSKAMESSAESNLRTLSTALEMYAAEQSDHYYPQNEDVLVAAVPPYLERTYDGQTVSGYTYSVKLSPGSYKIVASPDTCGVTGDTVFTYTEGGVLEKTECVPVEAQGR